MKHMIFASASVLAIIAAPTHAQTAQAPAEAAPQDTTQPPLTEDGGGLEDIIVTAQRTEETAQRTPIAIAVVEPEELIRQNVTRAEDLSRIVPALVATASGGPNTSFFLRGVGNTTTNSYSDPAISFNYDGIYIGRPNATQGFFFDLQRIEVLKGPQGTLYGRNATGGAINVIPRRPEIGKTGGEFQVGYGNYDAIQAQAALNLPIGDDGAFRVAGAYNKRDGYLSDGTSDQDSLSLRAQVLAELKPNLTTRIGADFSHQGGIGTGSFIYGTFGRATPTAPFTFTPTPQLGPEVGVHDPRTEAFVQTRFIPQFGRFSEALGSYPEQDNSVWGFTNETNWTTGLGTLTVQAGYRESTINSLQTTSSFRAFFIDEESDQFTLEARFAGEIGDAVDFLVGAFLFDENIESSLVLNQLTLTPFQDYETGTNSKAVFGRLGFNVTDTLTLTAAGRYTDDTKTMNGLSNIFIVFCGSPAPPQDQCPTLPLTPIVRTPAEFLAFYAARGVTIGPPGSRGPNRATIVNNRIPINSTLRTDEFTYRFGADWQITRSNLLYASYETGFHAGGFNFGRGLETYQPEYIRAITIGSKNRFLGNRLQLNIEAFRWKYRDQQVAQFGNDFSTPPISVFYTSNVGSTTIQGVDVDMDFLVTPTTRISGSVQYLDSSYDDFLTFSGGTAPPNIDCPTSPATVNGSPGLAVDCSGKPGLFSPKWSFNIGAEQTIELGGFNLIARGGTRYRGDFFAAPSFQPWVISRAGFQSDASLTLAPESDSWFITAYINNIEDERRISQSNQGNALGTQSAVATAPRTYGVRLGAKF